MGVLDAWKNAEKVTYPVIGVAEKEDANVIGYNINEEITKDASNVTNANNSTTTGLATVIPGVNAPKLIETTSIYKNSLSATGGATISGSVRMIYPDDEIQRLRNWTISDEYGTIKFVNSDNPEILWRGLVIPSRGWYEFYVTYPTGGSTFSVDEDIYIAKGGHGNDINIHSYTGVKSTTQYYGSFRYLLDAGDAIYARFELHYSGGGASFTSNKTPVIQITKL